jgi:hypothetical protein
VQMTGSLVQQLIKGKADKLPPRDTMPGRYLRINRIFEKVKNSVHSRLSKVY